MSRLCRNRYTAMNVPKGIAIAQAMTSADSVTCNDRKLMENNSGSPEAISQNAVFNPS